MDQSYSSQGNMGKYFAPYGFINPRQSQQKTQPPGAHATQPLQQNEAPSLFGQNGSSQELSNLWNIYNGQSRLTQPSKPSVRAASPEQSRQPMNDQVSLGLVEVETQGEDGKIVEHAQGVYNVAQRYTGGNNRTEFIKFGSAGGATPMTPGLKPPEEVHGIQDLDQAIDFYGSDALNTAASQLRDEAGKQNGNRRVLNMSLGYSRPLVYDNVLQELENNPELQKNIAGGLTSQDGDAYTQRVVDYVDQRLDNSKVHKDALTNYRQAVGQANASGIVTVVAAGNEQEEMQRIVGPNVRTQPGAALNFLAQADGVISVAAHDRNGQIGEFSSQGGGRYNPDIAAPGVGVNTDQGEGKDGTSFASLAVAGAVTEILERNPNLSTQEIEALLKQTAYTTPAPQSMAGAGLLNVDGALQQADCPPGSQGQGPDPHGGTTQASAPGSSIKRQLSAREQQALSLYANARVGGA